MSTTVGIAIIAKDEEDNLPHLLASIDGAFDRAVLLDTGSTDNTVDVFAAWAKNQTGLTFSVARWDWINDFSDARNAADRLLLYGSTELFEPIDEKPLVDWRSWADCDDLLLGAANLRMVAENADERVTAFFATYDYAQDQATGKTVIELPRERLVRAGYRQPWEGRVHEATPIVTGGIMHIPPELVKWVHRKQKTTEESLQESNNRNLKILQKWNEEEPGNPRVVQYIGTELAVQGKLEEAANYFIEYLQLGSQWDQERAQVRRKLAVSYMIREMYDEAIQVSLEAIVDVPAWPDSYMTLAEAFLLGKNEPLKAEYWARRVLDAGRPDTVLIINPLDYTFQPRKVLALAVGRLGRLDEAIGIAEEALMINPNDPMLQVEFQEWRNLARRQRTAETYVMASEQLVSHDEQEKARILLEQCVPHFAYEHPAVVAERSRVRERLLWANDGDAYAEHYETGGSKPEDFIADENVTPLCEYLPRTQFLLEGIKDQIEQAQ